MTIHLGLIGCGWIAQTQHLPAIRAIDSIRVSACTDLDSARCAAFAAQHDIPSNAPSTQALLENPAINAVAILTPPSTHADLLVAALDAGKHVYVEKPLALTLEDCDRMIEAAQTNPHLKVMVGFNLRFHRFTELMRAAHEKFGSPHLIQSTFTNAAYTYDAGHWRAAQGQGGDIISDLAIHHFDLWNALTGRRITEVFAHQQGIDADSVSVTVSARLEDAAMATGTFSNHAIYHNAVTSFTSKGAVHADFYRFDGFNTTPAPNPVGGAGMLIARARDFVTHLPAARSIMCGGGDFAGAYRRAWAHFANCIEKDTTPISTLADGRAAALVAIAAHESLRAGMPIQTESTLVYGSKR